MSTTSTDQTLIGQTIGSNLFDRRLTPIQWSTLYKKFKASNLCLTKKEFSVYNYYYKDHQILQYDDQGHYKLYESEIKNHSIKDHSILTRQINKYVYEGLKAHSMSNCKSFDNMERIYRFSLIAKDNQTKICFEFVQTTNLDQIQQVKETLIKQLA